MSDMQDQAAQDSLLKSAASESGGETSSAAQGLPHNSAGQSMQPLLRSPRRTLLSNLRGERPNPKQHYKVGIYIRYFNQTKYADYLDYHVSSIRTPWPSAQIGSLLTFTSTKEPPRRTWKAHRNGAGFCRTASAAMSI